MATLHGLLRPWSEEELDRIHKASMSLLETTGVYVGSDVILDILETTDATVDRDSKTVRFPEEMVQDRVENSPGSWDRSPVERGEFKVTAEAATRRIWDYTLRRSRPTQPKDFVDVPRLVQALPNIDGAGGLVDSDDIPLKLIDIVAYRNRMIHCEKGGGGGLARFPSLHCGETIDEFDTMYDLIAAAEGKAVLEPTHDLSCFLGAASPLRWGKIELETAKHVIERGQVIGIGGNCTAGVQAPITPASTIMVDHAERLSGLCIVTSIDRNARFYFCNHPYMLDMQSGDVATGSPEQALLGFLGTQLLRHVGFTLVVSHPVMDTGSHTPDSQNAAEKAMYMLLTALGGARSVGCAGSLKEIICYEQLVIDNEIAGNIKHLIKGAEITDDTIALDAVREIGIGGEFLTSEATLAHLRQCYHAPSLFCRKRMSVWERDGAKDVLELAHETVTEILSSETPVFLDEQRIRAMDDVIERTRRKHAPEWDSKPFLPMP